MNDKLPKIFLNRDFFSRGRNLRWIKEQGHEAVSILLNVWLASSQERNCKIKKEDAYSLPFNLLFDSEKVVAVLESAVEVGLLDGDSEYYYNSQIVSDDINFKEKRKNYSKAHEKRKQNQDESKVNPQRIHDKSTMDLKKSTVNHIEYEYEPDLETDSELGKKNQPAVEATDDREWPPKIDPTDQLSKFLPDAYAQFDGNSEICLSSGRKPMRQYPEIWIEPRELAEILRIYSNAMPKSEYRRVFQKVRTWALSQIADGRNAKKLRTAGALMGWAMKEVVSELNEEVKLRKNSEART